MPGAGRDSRTPLRTAHTSRSRGPVGPIDRVGSRRCYPTPSTVTKEGERHEPRTAHRHVQGRHRSSGGGVLPPLYRPSENGHKLLRKPLGAQEDAIRGAALSLEAHRGTTVVGEMGTGKTFIAAAAAHMAGFKRILVLGPPHLVPKWKGEVEMTVPGARAVIVKSITDLERLRLSVGSGPLFAVMSREKAKLSYRWMPAVIERWATSRGRLLRDEETGEPFRVPCCPGCTAQIVDKDGVPLTDADLNRRKHTCANCGSPLWQADRSGPARYPLVDYVKHHMKGFFDLLVGDEVHEYKGRGKRPGHRRRSPRRRLRQVPQPVRDVDGRVFEHALPPALPVLA